MITTTCLILRIPGTREGGRVGQGTPDWAAASAGKKGPTDEAVWAPGPLSARALVTRPARTREKNARATRASAGARLLRLSASPSRMRKRHVGNGAYRSYHEASGTAVMASDAVARSHRRPIRPSERRTEIGAWRA